MEKFSNKTNKVILILVLTLAFIGLSSTIYAANSFYLNITSAKMYEGGKFKLTTSDNSSVTWSSNNTNIASVDRNGNVSAKAKGDVIITAAKSNGEQQTCKIKVKKVDKLTQLFVGKPFNVSEATLYVGQKLVLNASGATNWTTSLKSVAKVSSGTVEALKPGIAIISAKVNKKLVTCAVTVKKAPKEEVTTNPSQPAQQPQPSQPAQPSQPSYNIREIHIWRDNTDITNGTTTIGVNESLQLIATLVRY